MNKKEKNNYVFFRFNYIICLGEKKAKELLEKESKVEEREMSLHNNELILQAEKAILHNTLPVGADLNLKY